MALLPKDGDIAEWGVSHVEAYGQCWHDPEVAHQIARLQTTFEARSDDLILASSPKTGTTWLTSIVIELMGSASLDDVEAHAQSPSLEHVNASSGHRHADIVAEASSPRFYKTHLPHHLLTGIDSVTRSRCPILYVARNPKDMIVSMCKFCSSLANQSGVKSPWRSHTSVDDMAKRFVDGKMVFGPYHQHVLGYWEASKRERQMANPVFFVIYEEILKNPVEMVKRIAQFIQYPVDDERARQVVQRCSIDSLRQMRVNQGRSNVYGFELKLFFRQGKVGSWREEMSEETSRAIDRHVQEHFVGSGIEFVYD